MDNRPGNRRGLWILRCLVLVRFRSQEPSYQADHSGVTGGQLSIAASNARNCFKSPKTFPPDAAVGNSRRQTRPALSDKPGREWSPLCSRMPANAEPHRCYTPCLPEAPGSLLRVHPPIARAVLSLRWHSRALIGTEPAAPGHRSTPAVWWSTGPGCGRRLGLDGLPPGNAPLFRAGPVLMNFDESPIHHYDLQVQVIRQGFKQPLKDPALHPTAETPVHGIPFAEVWRPVAPRRAGAGNPEGAFHRLAIVKAGATGVGRLARQQWL